MSKFACLVGAALVVSSIALQAQASPFTVSHTGGGSWNSVYAQGFSPSVDPDPDLGLTGDNPIFLTQFQFFKSGESTNATDVRLAILNNMFANLDGLTTAFSDVVGLSTTVVADTTPIATGEAITFEFDFLPLVYGGQYAAVFVNVGDGGALTPVRVAAIVTNYIENPPGSGNWVPETNHGAPDDYALATSNFISTDQFGSHFNTFSGGGDANFVATFETDVVPEPAAMMLASAAAMGLLVRRRWA